MLSKDIIDRIIFKVLEHKASAEEIAQLKDWVANSSDNSSYFKRFIHDWNLTTGYMRTNEQICDEFKQVNKRIVMYKRKHYASLFMKYAALFIIGIVSGFVVYYNYGKRTGIKTQSLSSQCTMQDTMVRVLRSNGEVIALNEQGTEYLIQQKITANINKDTLIYDGEQLHSIAETNELIVPKGQMFNLILSDGTKVYLNSYSRLKYPTQFCKASRSVELEGEAFFEVAKDNEKPFYVKIGGVAVRVYGTSFNVNGNTLNGDVRVVLLNGSIGIVRGESMKMMTPGDEAVCKSNSDSLTIKKIDLLNYSLWKDGYLCFNNQDLEEILYQLSLNYNCTVFYQNNSLKKTKISACIRRERSLSDILSTIEQMVDVRFTLNEGTITVK